MTKKLKDVEKHGVTEYGRVSHEEVAKAMMKAQVWPYATQFQEISCISAMKAQEAECYPVVTDVAALKETVQCGDKIESERIYSDQYNQQKFIKSVVTALKDGKRGVALPDCSWKNVAQAWQEALND